MGLGREKRGLFWPVTLPALPHADPQPVGAPVSSASSLLFCSLAPGNPLEGPAGLAPQALPGWERVAETLEERGWAGAGCRRVAPGLLPAFSSCSCSLIAAASASPWRCFPAPRPAASPDLPGGAPGGAVRMGRAGRIRTKRQHVGGTVRREGGARWDRTGQGLDVDGRGWHSQVPRVTRRS